MINIRDMILILEDAALEDGILIHVGVDLSASDNLNWLVRNEMLGIGQYYCLIPNTLQYVLTHKGKTFLKKLKDYEARGMNDGY